VAEPKRDWTDDEPGAAAAWHELVRLRRRAFARPWKPLLIALMLTAAVVGQRARKTRSYGSRIVFRLTENDLDAATAPAPAKKLREYVLDVVFSQQRLLDVIQAHGLYPRELKRDPGFAVEAFRDDLEVEVWRNYFLEERLNDDAGRSARIAIAYTHQDRQQAYDVVRALGRLLMEHEEAARIAMAENALLLVASQVDQQRDDLARRHGVIAAKEMAAHRASPAEAALLRGQILAMTKALEPIELRLKDLQKKKNQLRLRDALERSQLGMRFELVDPGKVARLGVSKPRQLAFIGVIAFFVLLPFAGMAAGAFDSRIYDQEDVRRLGLLAMGHVKAFPGDNVGALRARLAQQRRVH
jgi:hypothetical protein